MIDQILTNYLFYINRIENMKNKIFLNYPGNVQEYSRISKNFNILFYKSENINIHISKMNILY